MPRKDNDPTEYTYQWAQKAVQMEQEFGYEVKILEKDNVTYENITQLIKLSLQRSPIPYLKRLQ